jgi:hypothetical protein
MNIFAEKKRVSARFLSEQFSKEMKEIFFSLLLLEHKLTAIASSEGGN